jgi:Transglycosylase-like domain
MSYSSLAQLVQHYESGGNYQAQNPTSTASGAYQFTNATWRNYATQAGVDTSQYPSAYLAPPAVQDQVFNQAVASNGLNDWTCPGCDPKLTNYLQQNPSAATLPVQAGGGSGTIAQGPTGQTTGTSTATGSYLIYDQNGNYVGTTTDGDSNDFPPGTMLVSNGTAPPSSTGGSTSTNQQLAGTSGGGSLSTSQATQAGATATNTAATVAAAAPGYTPSLVYGGPSSVGLSPGLAAGVGGWISGLETDLGGWISGIETGVGTAAKNAFSAAFGALQNWFTRLGLIIFAIVLIAIAFFALMWDHGGKEVVVNAASAAREGAAA